MTGTITAFPIRTATAGSLPALSLPLQSSDIVMVSRGGTILSETTVATFLAQVNPTFASVAALRAAGAALSSFVQNVEILGYYGVGDGGGGFLTLVPSGTDNGVTTFVDASLRVWSRVNLTALTPAMGGAKGDGASNDHDPLNGLFAVAASTGFPVNMCKGTAGSNYVVNSQVTVPDNVVINGELGVTIINGVGSMRAFALGNGVRIGGLNFRGFGSPIGNTTDTGLSLTSVANVLIDRCRFSNFAGSAIFGTGCKDITVQNCIGTQNIGDSTISSSEADFLFQDGNGKITFFNNTLDANTNTAIQKQIGIFVVTVTGGQQWRDVQFIGNHLGETTGFQRSGLIIDDEVNPVVTGSMFARILGNHVANSGQEAIKCKRISRVICNVNTIDGFELIGPENAGSGLQGAILLNGAMRVEAIGNIIIGGNTTCTNGIRLIGDNTTGSFATPTNRCGGIVANNYFEAINQNAIVVSVAAYDVAISGNSGFNLPGLIYVNTSSPSIDNNPNMVSITGNTMRGYLGNGVAVSNIHGIWLQNCSNVTLAGNTIAEANQYGLFIDGCTNVDVTNDKYPNGNVLNVANAGGIRCANTVTNLSIDNTRVGNFNGYTQVYNGFVVGSATITGLRLTDCDFSTCTTAVVSGTLPAGSIVHDVKGYLFTTTALNPNAGVALASGASWTSANIAVGGAAFGDLFEAMAPYTLQGCLLTTSVDSAGNVKVTVANLTGAPVTFVSGTWTIRGQKVA